MENGNSREELAEKKRAIRKEMLLRRGALTEAERRKAAILLAERILGHQWFYRSDTLLGFAGCGGEIDTEEILREALRQGKRVYLPKVLTGGEAGCMEFYRIQSLAELQSGYRGIPEPSGEGEPYAYNSGDMERVLMLMPGVAFDSYRNRLGYGGGFYDRYLAGKERLRLRTIGVGFRCQMVELLPSEEQDVRPYQVICV
ncbi:MAG: 5-formyltetrahydrofolate cyclo-ligase [Roseburia sp.]|nr:5-formyltetrahydrofolate cyclo-ligase [Roseburia sp.]MCM1097403.1 5-formyltetrahydrofolate cyclo-ligase [Ruminococcus flavefaciens]